MRRVARWRELTAEDLSTAAALASTHLPLTFTRFELNDRQPTRGWLNANGTAALAARASSSQFRANRKCRRECGGDFGQR